ncbi:MAG TPA: hypothetical protein VMZ11_00280 [Mycobacteriales bacterium]|nr:hypothetical protein [Mycobacteriales bacterium]
MNVSRLLTRTAAVVLPAALVLGATGTAFAAKPPRTPVPTVTSTPAKVSNSKTATFVWTTVSNTTYTCSLDGSAYSACASGKTYTNLADRAHTFALKAKISTPANSKASTYTYGWTVDTLAPLAPVVSPIAGPTSNRSAAVSFSDTDASVTGFTCALDGAAAVACTSPQGYSGLADGSHTVVVAAHDAAGNVASGSVTWVVDTAAPNIPVVTGPTSPTNNPNASVSFSGDGITYTCKLDAEAPAPCTSPWTRSGLADGSHTLVVTPYDDVVPVPNAGTPGSATWVIDSVAPSAPLLVSAPASPTNDVNFAVRVASTDLSTAGYLCTFELSTAPCGTTWTPAPGFVPTNGAYALSVVAIDQAGNTSPALPVAWSFDGTAPAPAEFVTGPATPTNVTNPTFDFVDTDTDTDHFTCAVDAGTPTTCVAGVSLSALGAGSLAEGSHSLSVRAVDSANNVSAPVVWHWLLDTSGPSSQPNAANGVPLHSGPVTSTPTFAFTTNDPNAAGFVCKLDGAPTWTPCTSGYTPAVGDGSHTLQVATVDQAGNAGTPISYTWTLDTHSPLGVIAFPTTNLTGVVRVSFNEPVLGVTTSTVRLLLAGTTTAFPTTLSCRNAFDAAVSCASAAGVRSALLSHSARLVPGQKYTVKVTGAVHDPAGNAGSAPATVYRALRVLQENEPAVSQAWNGRSTTAAYGGRYVQAHLGSAVATYAFRGTAITWYTVTGPAMGMANVYCGNVLKATVNNYATATHYRVARTVKCSTSTANNVLRVVTTGKKSTASKGTTVVVDAVKVGTTLTTNPKLSHTWGSVPTSGASGGRYGVADTSGDAFSLVFRGTSITWRTLLAKNMGKAKVYVDGVLKGTYDQYSATTKWSSRTWKFTDKVHTIKVVLTGTHRAGATGNRVVVDSLTVG